MMSLFPRSSSESHCPSETGESLSEAFLNSSSRTRDSLPEQYQSIFDELRNGILAFCQEFEIPNEALKDLKAFEFQLTSKKIPAERMAEAVLLFQQLEHLVTHGEPLKETLPEHFQETERLYHLTEQYTAQFNLLKEAGILNERNAIVGIDGKEYPVPTLEQIAKRLYEREKELSIKRDQGFIKLLLVPFGMSLDALRETLKQFLLAYKQTHEDFDLDINDPLWTWEEGYKGADIGNPPKMFYYPKFFDDNHQGQTKTQILEAQKINEASFPGWTVHLFQPSDTRDLDQSSPRGIVPISQEGEGRSYREEHDRPDVETNKTPIQYLAILEEAQDDPTSPYHYESGLTPEDWIFAFMTHLEETGKPLDDYIQSIAFLTEAFFPSVKSPVVPIAYWDRTDKLVRLGRNEPHIKDGIAGLRTSVIV